MSEPFLGEIRMAGFNFAPTGWALCQGQTMSIAQNAALFSLLGTQFGGDGRTTFCLPNLQGRVPMDQGNGAGLPPAVMGEVGGQPTVTILTANMPQHTHQITPAVSNANAASGSPVNGFPAVNTATVTGGTRGETVAVASYASSAVSGQSGGSYPSGIAGSGLPISVASPYLCVNFIIALNGIFPSRS